MSGSVRGKIVQNGLIIHIDPANTSSYISGGDTAFDLSKNNRNCSLLNGSNYSSDGSGSFAFDGIDDFISIPAISGLSDFTISLWFKCTGPGTTGSPVYNTLIGSPGTNRILVATGTNKFLLAQMGGGNYVTSTKCEFNLWHNVVYTYDSVNDIAQFYVNNIKENSQANSSATFNGSIHFLGTFINPVMDYMMKGFISSFFIYNRKLSDSEVTNNYNTLRGRFGR